MLDFVAPIIFTIFGYMIKKYIGEYWADIKDFVGLYQVSNFGKVRNTNTGRILKQQTTKRGYLQVGLWKNNKEKKCYVHRLVAQAFIPNPKRLKEVNHKDEDKTNNFVWVNPDGTVDLEKSNLEWCTRKYNCNYGSIQIKKSSSQSIPIYQYTLEGVFVKRWKSATEVEKTLGFDQGNICNALQLKKRYKTAYGYIWKYERDAV